MYDVHVGNSPSYIRDIVTKLTCRSATKLSSRIISSTCCGTAFIGFPSRSASSSSCVCWHTRLCIDWHRRTSPTSVDQSQPSVADKDSDPPLVATLLPPPLSRTLAPVHLLWRVLRPGINCRCTYEHGSQSVPSRRHWSHISTSLTNYEFSRHAAPL